VTEDEENARRTDQRAAGSNASCVD